MATRILAVCALLMAASGAQAQVTKPVREVGPCCAITRIDAEAGVVTARDPAGRTFRFAVESAALLRSLRVGQAVDADFVTGRVSVNGASPCCAILRPAEPVGRPAPQAAEPCCRINGIDVATRVVTAAELASGRVFRFEVKDGALLGSLKVGQKVHADFGTGKVRIHTAEPCCNIIGHSSGSDKP